MHAQEQLTQTGYLYSQGWIIAVKYILAKSRNIYSVAKKLIDNYSRKREVLQGREREKQKLQKEGRDHSTYLYFWVCNLSVSASRISSLKNCVSADLKLQWGLGFIQLSQHHPPSVEGGNHADLSWLPEITYLSRVSMTWLPPGSRKPVLVYLLLNQFCKEQKAQQMPPTPSQPLCSLCKSDLSRRRSRIKHSILLSGKINTLFNSLLLYSAWGTMKPCSVLSMKATGANHLTVITHCIQVNLEESWGLWQGWGLLWVQWARVCLHHGSHPSHSSLPGPSSCGSSRSPIPCSSISALSNGKVCAGIRKVNLQ